MSGEDKEGGWLDEGLSEWARIERLIAAILLGGLLFVLLVTGMVLLSYYRPASEYASHDMSYLQFDRPVGMIMRSLHRQATVHFIWWAALHGLWLVAVFVLGQRRLQLSRSALVAPCVLLAVPLAAYVVPWDWLWHWWFANTDVAVADAAIAARYDTRSFFTAGRLIGEATERRFVALHAMVAPAVVAAILSLRERRMKPR
jgi:quinol-cytochrome oxidoreductase complex cytochrome b subunit